MKYDERACHFNMDTGCVELLLRDGRKVSIDCNGIKDSACGFRLTHGLAPQQADAEPVHCFIATDSWSMPLSSKGIIYHSCGIARQNWFTYNKTLDTSGLYWMERQRVIFHSAVAMVSFKRPAPSSGRKTEDRADSLRRNTV